MMKAMRKSRVSLALTAALTGAAVSMAPQQAAAQFSANGTGQVLIFPYYTVNDGWRTLLNVTNVNTTAALAVKVRFHEAQNSRDVLDFNVLMSPGDAWTGWVEFAPDQNPNSPTFGQSVAIFKTEDATCTSPTDITGTALSEIAYTGVFDDNGSKETTRLHEGYVELIVMGQCNETDPCFTEVPSADPAFPGPGIGWLTEHVDGTPRDCATADSYFIARDAPYDLSAATVPPGNGNPIAAGDAADIPDPRGYLGVTGPAPLKGNVSYVNIGNGMAAGSEAMHVDSIIPPTSNLVSAQNFPWFLEPTIATVPSGVLWDVRSINVMEGRLAWTNVINEWSANPTNGVLSDWVVNFPTKGYHVDKFCGQMQANNNRWRQDGLTVATCAASPNEDDYAATPVVDVAPFETRWQDVTGDGIAESPITVTYSIFDREEGTVVRETGGTTPSPAPPQEVEIDTLQYETNVLSIGGGNEAVESALASVIAAQLDAVDLLASGSTFGWLNTGFTGTPSADVGSAGVTYRGLPTVGFLMKTRNFGDATLNFGQMMQHAYLPVRAPNGATAN